MTGPTRPYIAPFLNLYPEIDNTAVIAATAAVVRGQGAGSSIWHQVTLRGDSNYITVGDGTNIQDNSCVHINSEDYPAIIGNHVNIGHSALVHACTPHDHAFVGMSMVLTGRSSRAMEARRRRDADPGQAHPNRRVMAGGQPEMRGLTQRILPTIAYAQHYVEVGRAHRLGASGAPLRHAYAPLLPR